MTSLKKWLQAYYRKVIIVAIHVLAWVLYMTFYRISYVQQGDNSQYETLFLLSILLTDLPFFYYYYFRAIPKLLVGRKAWKFVNISLLLSLAYPIVRYGLDTLFVIYYPDGASPLSNIATGDFNTVFGFRALAAVFIIAMAGIGKFTFDWFENARIRRELESQNLSSELAFLKSQINPHFLFNTLNNIHTLAYKKSDGAPEAIMKLSDLMRYMIYESDMTFVPLSKEIQHLRSFIDLQELRFKTKKIVELSVVGGIGDKLIAPLLLLPFLENAFKHGDRLNEVGTIKVRLSLAQGITYEVENLKHTVGHDKVKDQTGGIGLDNIRRRLELIYPKCHTFDVDESSSHFRVKLTLKDHG
ncbi:MAG: two-component system LytT family sensor kinase [Roseivirga sp.]|jgi:two-component system LytT family sensor kinase